jgi:hypothetical protein
MFKKFKGIPVSTLIDHMDIVIEIKGIFNKKFPKEVLLNEHAFYDSDLFDAFGNIKKDLSREELKKFIEKTLLFEMFVRSWVDSVVSARSIYCLNKMIETKTKGISIKDAKNFLYTTMKTSIRHTLMIVSFLSRLNDKFLDMSEHVEFDLPNENASECINLIWNKKVKYIGSQTDKKLKKYAEKVTKDIIKLFRTLCTSKSPIIKNMESYCGKLIADEVEQTGDASKLRNFDLFVKTVDEYTSKSFRQIIKETETYVRSVSDHFNTDEMRTAAEFINSKNIDANESLLKASKDFTKAIFNCVLELIELMQLKDLFVSARDNELAINSLKRAGYKL